MIDSQFAPKMPNFQQIHIFLLCAVRIRLLEAVDIHETCTFDSRWQNLRSIAIIFVHKKFIGRSWTSEAICYPCLVFQYASYRISSIYPPPSPLLRAASVITLLLTTVCLDKRSPQIYRRGPQIYANSALRCVAIAYQTFAL